MYIYIYISCIYIYIMYIYIYHVYIYIYIMYIYISCIYIYIYIMYIYIYIMYIYIYIMYIYIYNHISKSMCELYNIYIYIHIHVQIDHPTRTCLRHTHTHRYSRRGLRLPRGEAGGGVCLPQRRLVDVQMSRSRNLVKSMASGRCNVIIPTYVYIYICMYI